MFRSKSIEPIDSRLETALLYASENTRKFLVRSLEKDQAAILAALQDGENPQHIALARSVGLVGAVTLVVTDRRSAEFRDGTIVHEVRHSTGTTTRIFKKQNTTQGQIEIESHNAKIWVALDSIEMVRVVSATVDRYCQ